MAMEAEKIEERPFLRDCQFCHTKGDDEEVLYLTKEVGIATGCEFVIGYSVRCTQCGVSIHDEYKDEVVRLWNGEPVAEDEE